jgi:osmotically-inducible protein OsmY
MRRKYFGLAIAAIATLGPLQASGGDREIAEQIIERLKSTRDSGALKDFTLDMKVDQGVVLFRGNVSQGEQKKLVLGAAQGIEGVVEVLDEVMVSTSEIQVVNPAAAAEIGAEPLQPGPVQQNEQATSPELSAPTAEKEGKFSFRTALTNAFAVAKGQTLEVAPGEVRPAAAIEPVAIDPIAVDSGDMLPVAMEPVDIKSVAMEPAEMARPNDQQVVASVIAALSQAQNSGQLKGFGVDVKCNNGVLQLTGRASSVSQRATIIQVAESVPGVAGIREAIAIPSFAPNAPHPQHPSLQNYAATPAPAYRPQGGVPSLAAAGQSRLPVMTAPYRTQPGSQTAAFPAAARGPIAGQPVPVARYAAAGAPRYDSPNLPNYAWPGYAAHPNYAAVTYPQQYSPSAWPYIGPFYPYPQVPLGWRKVSLEWDDGWWALDFTDR